MKLGRGTHKGFSAINNIFFRFENSDVSIVKILRFGKAGTMYRYNITFNTACLKCISF